MPRREAPAKTGFRRRLPLELTAPELELLERAEGRFGTKRATLVAGLEALARLEALERELAETREACERAGARADELLKREERLAKELEKTKGDASAAKRGKQAVERVRERAKQARAEADALAQALREEQEARLRLEEELDEVEADLFDALRCARCGRWAPPAEWSSRENEGREYVYHRPCGYHVGGLLDASSLLGQRGSR